MIVEEGAVRIDIEALGAYHPQCVHSPGACHFVVVLKSGIVGDM